MGARSTGRINSAVVLRSLRSPQRECLRRADKGKAFAEVIAPVDTGNYKASFSTREIDVEGKRGARLANDAKSAEGYLYALALERGTSKMAAQNILGRSIDAMRG